MRLLFILIVANSILVSTSSFKKKQKAIVLNSAKTIQKNIKQITPILFAGQTEVTNAQYNAFVQVMQLQNPTNYLQYLLDTTGWINSTISNNVPYMQYYHKYPSFATYPVVNVSYANAVAYCNWLTNLYNTDKNKKYKKVVFSLPTKDEWEQAASGGRKQAVYSWGSYYTSNRNGEMMCNFKRPSDVSLVTDSVTGMAKQIKNNAPTKFRLYGGLAEKRFFYTASCKSFYPNPYGLYNCCGNVAEMINTDGIAKGGSWHCFSGEVTIQSQMAYSKPNPEIGFRIFMHVIEE